jgi:hypothetical protein
MHPMMMGVDVRRDDVMMRDDKTMWRKDREKNQKKVSVYRSWTLTP